MLNAWNQAEGKVAHRKLVALKEYIDLRIAALEGEAGSKGGLKDAGKGPPL